MDGWMDGWMDGLYFCLFSVSAYIGVFAVYARVRVCANVHESRCLHVYTNCHMYAVVRQLYDVELCACICLYARFNMNIDIFYICGHATCMYTSKLYTRVCVHRRTGKYIYMRTCTYICMYTYIHTHTHTSTSTYNTYT